MDTDKPYYRKEAKEEKGVGYGLSEGIENRKFSPISQECKVW